MSSDFETAKNVKAGTITGVITGLLFLFFSLNSSLIIYNGTQQISIDTPYYDGIPHFNVSLTGKSV